MQHALLLQLRQLLAHAGQPELIHTEPFAAVQCREHAQAACVR